MSKTAQLEKVVLFGAEVSKVVSKVGATPGVVGKVMALSVLADDVVGVLSLDVAALKVEYTSLDEAGRANLRAVFAPKFDLENDVLEAKIEDSLERGLMTIQGIQGLITTWAA